jgi:hypothetical protein
MVRIRIVLALLCAAFSLPLSAFTTAVKDQDTHRASSVPFDNPVVEWNKTLLAIVRTPKPQPASVHSTRSFAIMHAAIYDAVNSIDRTHKPYLVRLSETSRNASQEAAADAAAHDVLVALYPNFQVALDAEFHQLLSQIADGEEKTAGIRVGSNCCRPDPRAAKQ